MRIGIEGIELHDRPRLSPAPVPPRRSPTSAPTNTAAVSKTACASRSKSSTPCAPRFPRTSRSGVRVSASDWVEGRLGHRRHRRLRQGPGRARGAAAIHVSSGGVSNAQQIAIKPAYQVHFAERSQAGRRHAGHRRRSDHRGGAGGRDHRKRPGRRHRSGPCASFTTRAGPGMPRPNSARRWPPRRNTGAPSRTA